ncbi:hypothetical protein K491DRAFT_109426 [Lophiostoma macrostomum CBS 122681]|uniref:F-box domain-containing protein n=1 Tax=Lophiostoma macrostomum CBS 122681 TaxID=1314788 RepID=A0A6A6TK15_9PLEO|nr:hypothetical protein K491DRAFT_109426 [Lophiostoma macrostomum CBS 122681]
MEPHHSHLLRLPRELRNNVYSYLLESSHVYTSRPKSNTQSVQSVSRSNRIAQVHIDTRIYVPVRPDTNVLRVCSQLREEYLDSLAHSINSASTAFDLKEAATDRSANDGSAELASTSFDDMIERARDEGCVRITLEIQRLIRGVMGGYMPARDTPSPLFISLVPVFSRLKKIKFLAWSAWSWWTGPPKRLNKMGQQRARLGQTDDSKDPQVPQAGETSTIAGKPCKPDDLSLAIETLLEYLPLVEEIHIDLLMHEYDYWNWDLPEDRWVGIQQWLDSPISPPKRGVPLKVYRRLLSCEANTPARAAIFYHQLEERKAGSDGSDVVQVSRGSSEVPEEWAKETLLRPPPFTEIFERAV